MSKRRGGNLPRVMPRKPAGLDIRMVMPGLEIVAPDPLAVSLGESETAGLQLAAEPVRVGYGFLPEGERVAGAADREG